MFRTTYLWNQSQPKRNSTQQCTFYHGLWTCITTDTPNITRFPIIKLCHPITWEMCFLMITFHLALRAAPHVTEGATKLSVRRYPVIAAEIKRENKSKLSDTMLLNVAAIGSQIETFNFHQHFNDRFLFYSVPVFVVVVDVNVNGDVHDLKWCKKRNNNILLHHTS